MKKRMLINATGEEVRVAVIDDRLLQHLHVEHIRRDQLKGNIYRGVVVRVEPAIQAAFVDYGAPRNGFLAAGDVLPHWYAKNVASDRRPRLEDVLRKGQRLLVQVIREEEGSKGAALTTRLSLPGRYMVLMPWAEGGGISRKIEDESQRKRLREIHRKLQQENPDFGLIVRTVGIEQTKAELEQDLQWLQRLWKNVEKAFTGESRPGLIFQEQDVVLRVLRDYFTTDIDEVLIDDEEALGRVLEYVQTIMPRHKKKFSMYRGERPLFGVFGLESQIDAVYQRKVPLKSGGALVIDRTEALVAIDVNSGRSLREKDMEATALHTNQEAAEEVARQLRLRDLGGLVVVDFIDMKDGAHRRAVERSLAQAMKQDKARHQLGRIDDFGLLVLSRQRIRPPLDKPSYEPCNVCQGRGMVRSTDSLALEALRSLRSLIADGRGCMLARAELPTDIAMNLLNQRRNALIELERQTGVRIEVSIGHQRPGERGRFEGLTSDPLREQPEAACAPVQLERGEPTPAAAVVVEPPSEPPPEEVVAEEEAPAGEQPAAEPAESECCPPDELNRRRRRRRRSRHRKRDGELPATDAATTQAARPEAAAAAALPAPAPTAAPAPVLAPAPVPAPAQAQPSSAQRSARRSKAARRTRAEEQPQATEGQPQPAPALPASAGGGAPPADGAAARRAPEPGSASAQPKRSKQPRRRERPAGLAEAQPARAEQTEPPAASPSRQPAARPEEAELPDGREQRASREQQRQPQPRKPRKAQQPQPQQPQPQQPQPQPLAGGAGSPPGDEQARAARTVPATKSGIPRRSPRRSTGGRSGQTAPPGDRAAADGTTPPAPSSTEMKPS